MTQPQFNRSRFSRIMSWGAFQALSEATHTQRNRLPYEIPMTKYFTQKRPARLLTKCVLEYIRTIGGHAEEVKTTGTMRKDRTGKMIWAYSQTMTGSADIHAVISGRFIAIRKRAYKPTYKKKGGYQINIDYKQALNIATKFKKEKGLIERLFKKPKN